MIQRLNQGPRSNEIIAAGARPVEKVISKGIWLSTLGRWRSEVQAIVTPRAEQSLAIRFSMQEATAMISEEESSAWYCSKEIFSSDLDVKISDKRKERADAQFDHATAGRTYADLYELIEEDLKGISP